jgi:hypothetical protein
MAELTCEEELIETFAILADTLLTGYDVVELMQTLVESCTSLFDVEAAGILLVDGNGELEVVAQPDISASPARWSQFRREALAQGFTSVYAIPMGVKDTMIGTLNLLKSTVGELGRSDVRATQALAAVATVGILHERALRESNAIRDQLASALEARVVIEQAKGVLAHTHGASMDETFSFLRGYARSHGQKLSVVANDVVAHDLRI